MRMNLKELLKAAVCKAQVQLQAREPQKAGACREQVP